MIPPVFTAAQADAGELAYARSCAPCHGGSLEGAAVAPPLAGRSFDRSWRGKPLSALSFHVRRMPPEQSAESIALDDETYTNILAHTLRANGFVPGDASMPSDITAQGAFTITPEAGADYDPMAPAKKTTEQSALLAGLTEVSDAMLRNPPAGDWLHWGRTYAGQSHSPLKQIDRRNVNRLSPVWRAPLVHGTSMPMPLVHQGVMFLQTWPDTVLAMDAATGAVLWRYQRKGEFRHSKKMGVSLHEDRVYVATSDMHLVALDFRTGEVVWDHALALESHELRPDMTEMERLFMSGQQYHTRNAPLVAGKVVIQGTMAYRVPKGSYIIAVDRETGQESWRFNTIAWPGQQGGDTWNGIPVEARNGGSVWQQGTYDPETNLVYFGIAPTYDTAPLLKSSGLAGHTNEAMFTNCTVALNADTGELVWYYQHTQNDQWDLDWAFERTLADLPKENGGTVRAVMNVGKIAILDALEASTGRYLFSVDTGVQNFITAIDPITGAKTIDPAKMPNPNNAIVICPHLFGSRAWPQTSYSPDRHYLYVPITESCVKMSETDKGGFLLTTGVNFGAADHPGLADGMMGRLQAIDLRTRALAWNRDQVTPPSTGMLTTSGGLLFAGDIDPSLNAFDDATGELLWEYPLDDLPSSSVITYRVGDTQYIAVVVGMMNNWIRDITRHYRQWSSTEGAAGDEGGGAVWAFALPPND
jgi:alcohol dehydrogenase (cytochrome c)